VATYILGMKNETPTTQTPSTPSTTPTPEPFRTQKRGPFDLPCIDRSCPARAEVGKHYHDAPAAAFTQVKLALRRDSLVPVGQAANLYVECCKTGDVRTIIWIDDEFNTCATCGRTVDRSGWVVSSSSPEAGR